MLAFPTASKKCKAQNISELEKKKEVGISFRSPIQVPAPLIPQNRSVYKLNKSVQDYGIHHYVVAFFHFGQPPTKAGQLLKAMAINHMYQPLYLIKEF